MLWATVILLLGGTTPVVPRFRAALPLLRSNTSAPLTLGGARPLAPSDKVSTGHVNFPEHGPESSGSGFDLLLRPPWIYVVLCFMFWVMVSCGPLQPGATSSSPPPPAHRRLSPHSALLACAAQTVGPLVCPPSCNGPMLCWCCGRSKVANPKLLAGSSSNLLFAPEAVQLSTGGSGGANHLVAAGAPAPPRIQSG